MSFSCRFTTRMENKQLIWLINVLGAAFLWWFVLSTSSTPRLLTFQNTLYMTQTTAREAICTFTFINNYIKTHKTFTNSGRFVGLSDDNMDLSSGVFYDPGICNLKLENDASFTSCLRKTKTKKILFLGDSNTRKLSNSFLNVLKKSHNFICYDVHNNTPRDHRGNLKIPKNSTIKDCPWIFRRVYVCQKTLNLKLFAKLEVHYIKMAFLQSPVQFNSSEGILCPDVSNQNITTLEEYILRDYASQMNPDIMILGSTAHLARYKLSKWTGQETWLMKQVIHSIPHRTRVFWFSHMAYCDEKQDEEHARIRIKDSGQEYTISQQFHRQNVQFYKLLNDILLKNHHNIFPFFDLYNMSGSVCSGWHVDQIHCVEEFYDILVDTFWAVYCKSFPP